MNSKSLILTALVVVALGAWFLFVGSGNAKCYTNYGSIRTPQESGSLDFTVKDSAGRVINEGSSEVRDDVLYFGAFMEPGEEYSISVKGSQENYNADCRAIVHPDAELYLSFDEVNFQESREQDYLSRSKPGEGTVSVVLKLDRLKADVDVGFPMNRFLPLSWHGFFFRDGKAYFHTISKDYDYFMTGPSETNFLDGEEHRLVGVFTENSTRLYVDGVLESSSLNEGGDYMDVFSKYYEWPSLLGDVHEVRLYDHALTDDEVEGLYQGEGKKEGLMTYWSDEVYSGTLADDLAGDNTAQLFSREDGTVYNCSWTDGRFGQALRFDGNSRVELIDTPSRDAPPTLAAWVKLRGEPADQTIIRVRSTALVRKGNRICMRSGDPVKELCSSELATDEWLFVVARTTHEQRLYINGNLEASKPFETVIKTYAVYDSFMGGSFVGDLDEVRYYLKALDEEEIGKLYRGEAVWDGFAYYWPFEEGSGQVVHELHSHVDGVRKEALLFDGETDRIEVLDSDSLDPSGEITQTAWFYNPEEYGFPSGLVRKELAYEIFLTSQGDKVAPGAMVVAGDSGTRVVGPTASRGEWHFVAYTYDSSTRVVKLWVDGELVKTETLTGRTDYAINKSLSTLFIPDLYVLGNTQVVDEVYVYNKALGEQEIAAMTLNAP